MTIDLMHEQGLPLKEVPLRIPKRNGKKVHYSTVYRWATKGARGRILETTLVGGIRYTTIEALARFLSEDTQEHSSSELAAINEALNRAGV